MAELKYRFQLGFMFSIMLPQNLRSPFSGATYCLTLKRYQPKTFLAVRFTITIYLFILLTNI